MKTEGIREKKIHGNGWMAKIIKLNDKKMVKKYEMKTENLQQN